MLVTTLVTILIVALPTIASASPSSTADAGVYMVDGPVVHDVVVHAGRSWIGGRFSEVENQNGSPVANASGLTVFGADGTLIGSVHANLPRLGGTRPTVWDLSLGPDGILYVAGKFTYSHGGNTYKNLVGINPSTGEVVAAYRAANLKAVLATSDYVYAGGRTLRRYRLGGGNAGDGWHVMKAYIDPSLRGHKTTPTFREIEQISDSTLLVVGQFDWIDGQDAAHQKKVAVKVNAANGQPSLGAGSWSLQCECVRQAGASFGLAAEIAGDIAYIAAGGSDWIGAFRVSDGSRLWVTDVNGSAQDLTVYDGTSLIVGGHWTYLEDDGPGDQSAGECPSRKVSNPDPCWAQPRLARIGRSDGMPDKGWTPRPCCRYRGVWATVVDGTTIHIGGEFTRLDGESEPEHFYGRFH